MEQNLAASIGICDVVASSGVSMRTLYHGFRTCHEIPPMTGSSSSDCLGFTMSFEQLMPPRPTSPTLRPVGASFISAVLLRITTRTSVYSPRTPFAGADWISDKELTIIAERDATISSPKRQASKPPN